MHGVIDHEIEAFAEKNRIFVVVAGGHVRPPGRPVIALDRAPGRRYAQDMRRRTLLETNPYLKDPAAREAALIRTVESSTAIEGVFVNLAKAQGDARKQRATAHTAKGRKERK